MSIAVYSGFDDEIGTTAVFFLPTAGDIVDPTTSDANCRARPTGASSCLARSRTKIVTQGQDDFFNVGSTAGVVEMRMGGGADRVFTTGSRIEAYGEAGNDELGRPGHRQLDGGEGNDDAHAVLVRRRPGRRRHRERHGPLQRLRRARGRDPRRGGERRQGGREPERRGRRGEHHRRHRRGRPQRQRRGERTARRRGRRHAAGRRRRRSAARRGRGRRHPRARRRGRHDRLRAGSGHRDRGRRATWSTSTARASRFPTTTAMG